MFQTTFTHWALVWDPCLFWFCPDDRLAFWLLVTIWSFSKFAKLMPLFVRRPTDMLMVPVSIIFGYLHGFIKLYAGLTLHVVSRISLQMFLCDSAYRTSNFEPRRYTARTGVHAS